MARITIKTIIEATARVTGVPNDDILSRIREKPVARARHLVMWIACKRLHKTTLEVGRIMGRDHSTVIHGTQTIRAALDVEEGLANTIEEIWTLSGTLASRKRFSLRPGLEPKLVVAEPPQKPQDVVPPAPPSRAAHKVEINSPAWWAANDAAFRAGIARAYRAEAAE